MSGDETFKSILANFALDLITKKGFVSIQELKSALLDAGHEQAKLGTFSGYLNFNRNPYESPFGENGILTNITKTGYKNGTKKGLCFREFDDEIETDKEYIERRYYFTDEEWNNIPRVKPKKFGDQDKKNHSNDNNGETSAGEIDESESEVVVEDIDEGTVETCKERIKRLLDELPELTPEDKIRILGGDAE
jgi:hypothetical protein